MRSSGSGPYLSFWSPPLHRNREFFSSLRILQSLMSFSPWWLVRHGKIDEARKSLARLTSRANSASDVEDTLAMIIHTNELEIQQTAGTSYADCFKGVDRRRTELTVMSWVVQQTSGSAMMGWGTYFMLQVGLSQNNAYSLGIGNSAMGFVGTVFSWVREPCIRASITDADLPQLLMPHFGRRTLYLWGQGAMFIILIIIGGLGVPAISTSTGWAIGALLLVLTFTYGESSGAEIRRYAKAY